MKKIQFVVIMIIIMLVSIPIFSNATDSTAPTVTAIQVVSPTTGTYGEGQQIDICVYFDKKITGTTKPTLKIKFGSGDTRSLTNGTIHNGDTVDTFNQYIEYSYNIQDGDNGYLTIVSLSGGDIQDTDGNTAVLSAPTLTGSVSIKASTTAEESEEEDEEEADDEEETEAEDEEEEEEEETENETKNTSSSKSSTKNSNTTNSTDNTTSSKKLPYTGIGFGIIMAIIILIIAIIFTKLKYDNLKDIK